MTSVESKTIDGIFEKMTIVLGGGIGGLSAAYYLLKQANLSHAPKLFEASNRFGGWIKTDVSSADKRVRFEVGPRTIRPKGIEGLNTLALCSELGLSDEILPINSMHPAAKNRLLAVNDELCLLPNSLMGMFKTIPPFTKPLIFGLMHDMKHDYAGKPLTDDTMYNFIERRFGTEMAKYLISSMICGICAGDAKEISVKFLMKELFEYEQKYSSVSKGLCHKVMERFSMKKDAKPVDSIENCDLAKRSIAERWSVYSLNGGLEKLTQTLSQNLAKNGVEMNTNAKCEHIEFNADRVSVTVNGKSYETNHLISSIPTFELGKLVQKQHPQLADELLAITYVDVAVLNFQFAGNNLLKQPGFGFLVPPVEDSPLLGVIYDSCCFDMGDNTVLTAMMGGKWFRQRFGYGDEKDLYEKAMGEIRRILKIDQQPEAFKVNILRKCIPQYVVGHYDRVERIKKYIEHNKIPLSVCGCAFEGVGVNNVICSAKEAAKPILK